MYDVVIIGGGVIGTMIARELSKYRLNIALAEKGEDVSIGATKANSGIIHGGYDANNKKLKGYFSRRGNELFDELEKELNFGFKRVGSMVLAFSEEELKRLEKLKENGIKNGVKNLEIIDKRKIKELEPNISEDIKYALYCKGAGVASPYELAIALMENAITNGVELFLNFEVDSIEKNENFIVKSKEKELETKYIINCAGVYSDRIAKMVGIDDFSIIPRKGEYILFDKGYGDLINHVLFQCPTKEGKGVLVSPTYHGNLLIGPDANEILNREDVSTNRENLNSILEKARKTYSDFDLKKVIRSFSGIRATSSTGDFIIGKTKVKNFINCAGIDSPGLTSSPAIGRHIVEIIRELEGYLEENREFKPYRKAIVERKDKKEMKSFKEIVPLVNLAEGNENRIVCRCEQVIEKEIIDALNRGIKVLSIDGVKRRTRAGMGVCQGGFCGSRVRKIIANYYKIPEEEVLEKGQGSNFIPKREGRFFWK